MISKIILQLPKMIEHITDLEKNKQKSGQQFKKLMQLAINVLFSSLYEKPKN